MHARMKPDLLHPSDHFLYFSVALLMISINTIPTCICEDDSQYTNCNSAFSCESSISDLKYPFWGGNREPYCGVTPDPDMELKCDGGVPKITINQVKYRILGWDNTTQKLTVARDDYWDDLCAVNARDQYKNSTFDNNSTPFRRDGEVFNVTLLYSCEANLPNVFYSFKCGDGTTVVYTVADPASYSPFCTPNVIVVIPILGTQASQLASQNRLNETIKEGFELKWSGNYEECAKCVDSDGVCGNDDKGAFRCFCKDGPYTTRCNSEKAPTSNCFVCLGSGGQHCGFDSDDNEPICICGNVLCPSPDKSNSKVGPAIGAAAGVAALIGILAFVCFVVRRRRKNAKNSRSKDLFMPTSTSGTGVGTDTLTSTANMPTNMSQFRTRGKFVGDNVEVFMKSYYLLAPKRYNYAEVKRITNSFRDKLGQGGYGIVYKASLPDGRQAAVKVISESKGNGEEFINEVASISRTSHMNIVSLLGFCYEVNKRALIYELMPNGSLDKFIYRSGIPNAICDLDWKTLFQIAIGIARGLEYLHQGCISRILHLDIKPQNILLDEDFCPKISDFGLAKVCQKKESIVSIPGTRGTIGYMAPEVFSRAFGGVSHKSDVYSYGMLILEIIGGRKNHDIGGSHTTEMYFPDWIYKDLEQDNTLVNWLAISEEENDMIRKITMVSLWCIQTNPSNRPSMKKVIEMLEGPLQSVPYPPKPILYSPERPPLQFSYMSSSNLYETNSITTQKNGSIESNEFNKDENEMRL